jgi:hypothetical protein
MLLAVSCDSERTRADYSATYNACREFALGKTDACMRWRERRDWSGQLIKCFDEAGLVRVVRAKSEIYWGLVHLPGLQCVVSKRTAKEICVCTHVETGSR